MLSLWARIAATLGPGSTAAIKRLTLQGVELAGASIFPLMQPATTATPTYGAAVSIDAANTYNVVVITDGVAHTVGVPTNAATGRFLTITMRNSSGGAAGAATFTGGAGGYRLAGAWVQAANANQRSVTFRFDGTNWIEIARNAADVAV